MSDTLQSHASLSIFFRAEYSLHQGVLAIYTACLFCCSGAMPLTKVITEALHCSHLETIMLTEECPQIIRLSELAIKIRQREAVK